MGEHDYAETEDDEGQFSYPGKRTQPNFDWVSKHCKEGVWRLSLGIVHECFSSKHMLIGG